MRHWSHDILGTVRLGRIIDEHEPERVALIDGSERLSFGELRARAAAMAQTLIARGHRPGDHFALACGNEMHFVTAMLGIWNIGGVIAPVNPYSPAAELERKMQLLQPACLVIGETTRDFGQGDDFAGVPVLDMATVPTATVEPIEPVELESTDLAVLLSTSGVSGIPKVAMLSHGNLEWVQQSLCNDGPEDVGSHDVLLAALPFAHVLGLNVVLLTALRAGATTVLQRRFNVDESLRLIQEHSITMLTGAPPMWSRWADADPSVLSTVRFARSGAASLPNDVHAKLVEHHGLNVRQGYGLTETSSVVATGRNTDSPLSSVGRPLPGIELVLVDEAGAPTDQGDIGEIVVRGPGVFAGYLDDQAATEAVLAHDGWLWTGDVGLFDDNGHLYLVDRIKDIIIVSGFNVYPAEVENVLMQHPGVKGAVVVGSDHGDTGETVIAHVSGDVSEQDLNAYARDHLSGYKVPTQYYFVDELPVAPSGKAIRRELRA
jgi:long-chain acyl-CoA synthetase